MRRYWDSCAFLGLLAEEPDKLPDCEAVIVQAQAGAVTIVTSALTLAEVLWLRGKPPIPASEAQKVQRFFRHSWIYTFTTWTAHSQNGHATWFGTTE